MIKKISSSKLACAQPVRAPQYQSFEGCAQERNLMSAFTLTFPISQKGKDAQK